MFSKEFLGLLSVVLTAIAYAPYIYGTLKRRIKPHIFTWIVGGIVNGVAFVGQSSQGGGAGAWVTGFTGLLCIGIVGLSIRRGDKNITKSDWVAFTLALLSVGMLYIVKSPLGAVVLASLIDMLGCYPTIRKSYLRPHEESAFMWGVAGLRSVVSLFALEHYVAVTIIYPLTLVLLNGVVTSMILWRRMVTAHAR